MDIAAQLSLLLGLAWLAPLASFVAILFFGPRMGRPLSKVCTQQLLLRLSRPEAGIKSQ